MTRRAAPAPPVPFTLAGRKVRVVADGVVHNHSSSVLVCWVRTIPLLSPDNVIRACDDCGDQVQVNPTSPRCRYTVCFPCSEHRDLAGKKGEAVLTRSQVSYIEQQIKRRAH